MTNTTNRRAVLGAVLAAGAVAVTALPAATAVAKTSIGDHPDAALLALGPEIEAADREYELREQQATGAWNVAGDMFNGESLKPPATPECLKTISEPTLIEMQKENRWEELRVLIEEFKKHEAALEAWQKEKNALQERALIESGLRAADEAVTAADKIRLTIRDEKLVVTRARTLEGLIFKAKYAASHFDNEYDEEVMISIVDDLIALGEEA